MTTDNLEKLFMKKLDQINQLTQHQLKLSRTQEVRDFLECDKILKQLKSEVRREINNNLIMKDQGFGVPRTFKHWSDVNMIDATITKDRKQVIGILKGEKVMADIRLQHYSPKEIKAYSSLVIKGWVG